MRRKVLMVGLATGWLTLCSQSTLGTASAAQTKRATGSQQVWAFPTEQAGLQELLLDRLTIPLGLANREDCWPFGVGGVLLSPRYD
jgi:hypothetical protein